MVDNGGELNQLETTDNQTHERDTSEEESADEDGSRRPGKSRLLRESGLGRGFERKRKGGGAVFRKLIVSSDR